MAEMIDLGQRRMTPEVMNVLVMGGFAYTDTARNGLTVVVTAHRDRRDAETLAREIAELGWVNRGRFPPRLTPLAEAVSTALAVGRDASLPALAFADVADNSGGGGWATPSSCCAHFTRPGSRACCSVSSTTRPSRPKRIGMASARACGAVQPVGNHPLLRALGHPRTGGRADRR